MRAVSLFSNCGAGDIGFVRAGFTFDVVAELAKERVAVAALNHPAATAVQGDLRKTLPEVVSAYRKASRGARLTLLSACPPCQGMSSARGERGHEHDADAGSRDDRNLLVSVIAQAVTELQPRLVVVENVPAFLRRLVRHPHTGTPTSAAQYLIEALDEYTAYPIVADLADFGVPQRRKRAFLTFVHNGEAKALRALHAGGRVPYPRASHEGTQVSLATALESLGLPPLDSATAETASSDVAMHFVPVLPRPLYTMVSSIPRNTGAGAWANDRCTACDHKEDDQDAATCTHCGERLPRPVVATSDGSLRLVTGFRRSSYTRMAPDEPASTITTASGRIGSDRTLHPFENRVLSPLECQHLQTFPSTFQWGDALRTSGVTKVRAMIGEAVPPQFTEKHGLVLRGLLKGETDDVMEETDSRVAAANEALTLDRRPDRRGVAREHGATT